ncbi:MAG: pitrilysin family protein [candidate division WOR-3 bacterium]|nr:pitrilysin family protein [candidate division WOR-3 bacterium]
MTGEAIRENLTQTGLRVVTERIPGFHSVALGVFFRQGSRDEDAKTNGTSHLIEHMLFKGTSKRSSKEILAAIERLGGMSDGFTAKEITGITVRCLADSMKPLLKLLFEMLGSSVFDAGELRKEKRVICEEMRSVEEDPQDMVFDRFFEACFAPHPLGYPVIGRRKTLSGIGRERLMEVYRKKYTLADSILVAVGNVKEEELISLLPRGSRLARGERKPRPQPAEKSVPVSMVHTRKDLTQVHAVMGTQTVGTNSDERFPLALLATLLGGGMSSRLFSLLREDKGLVYTISSFLELFEDCGVAGLYFITGKSKLGRVFRAIEQELSRLKRKGLNKGELDTAKILTKSSLLLSMESLSHRMMRLGHWKLSAQRFRTISETLEAFEKVTEDEVLDIARKLFDSKPFHTSFVGPITERDTNPLTRR